MSADEVAAVALPQAVPNEPVEFVAPLPGYVGNLTAEHEQVCVCASSRVYFSAGDDVYRGRRAIVLSHGTCADGSPARCVGTSEIGGAEGHAQAGANMARSRYAAISSGAEMGPASRV
jgi:hypothetical protein